MMWMMGATLNTTSSAAAKEMDMVLKSEIATHAAYETRPSYHGCPLPGKKQVCFHGKFHFRVKSIFAEQNEFFRQITL